MADASARADGPRPTAVLGLALLFTVHAALIASWLMGYLELRWTQLSLGVLAIALNAPYADTVRQLPRVSLFYSRNALRAVAILVGAGCIAAAVFDW